MPSAGDTPGPDELLSRVAACLLKAHRDIWFLEPAEKVAAALLLTMMREQSELFSTDAVAQAAAALNSVGDCQVVGVSSVWLPQVELAASALRELLDAVIFQRCSHLAFRVSRLRHAAYADLLVPLCRGDVQELTAALEDRWVRRTTAGLVPDFFLGRYQSIGARLDRPAPLQSRAELVLRVANEVDTQAARSVLVMLLDQSSDSTPLDDLVDAANAACSPPVSPLP